MRAFSRNNFGQFGDGTGPYVRGVVDCKITGKRNMDVLTDPRLNKGSGFDLGERDRLGIRGLVPSRCLTIN